MFPETKLRATMLAGLESIGQRDLDKLTGMVYDTYGGLVVGTVTKNVLVNTARLAKRSQRWTGSTSGDSRVGIGYYNTAAYYYTNLPHEMCHNILYQMGRPDSIYENNSIMAAREESLCWSFASEVCRMTSLPFLGEVVEISTAYFYFVEKLAEKGCIQDDSTLDEIGKREREKFGFSDILGDEFRWVEDVPLLLTN